MSVAWYFILWIATVFIIAQLRLGYVMYKRPRRFTTIAPTGTTGIIGGWTQGIHPHHAVEYMRRTGATALPLHFNPNTGEYFFIDTCENVNWGRDGF